MIKFIHQPHDKLFKQSMTDRRVAKDFFKAYLPKKILKHVKLKTLKLENSSFIDTRYQKKESDLIYSVQLDTGSSAYFYILCEHQSKQDSMMAFRLLTYLVRLMEQHTQQHPKEPLPIIFPLVLYSGKQPWNAPTDLFELFGQGSELARELLFKPYTLIELHKISDEDLRKQQWSGLFAFALKHRKAVNFAQFLNSVFPWASELEEKNAGQYLKILLTYVVHEMEADDESLLLQKAEEYLSNELRGEIMTLAQRFEQNGIQKGLEKGRQEGRQEGIELEKKAIARKLLKESLPLELVSKMTGLSIAWLKTIDEVTQH